MVVLLLSIFFTCHLPTNAVLVAISWANDFPDVKRSITVQPGGTLQIICPQIGYTSQFGVQGFDNVWRVDQSGYINCDASRGTLMALCQHPATEERITLPIVPRMGETIYLISTANGERGSIRNRKGGLCKLVNKKLIVFVLS